MNQEELWEKRLPELLTSIFPPRIVADVLRIRLPVDEIQITTVIERKKGLYFFGNVGTGKTVHAANLLIHIIKRYRELKWGSPDVLFITSNQLLERIRGSYNDCPNDKIVQQASESPLMLLDDFGTEKYTEWVLQMMNHIINTRYEYLRPTIITSNYDLNAIKAFDNRLASRISGMCEIIQIEGKDFRK